MNCSRGPAGIECDPPHPEPRRELCRRRTEQHPAGRWRCPGAAGARGLPGQGRWPLRAEDPRRGEEFPARPPPLVGRRRGERADMAEAGRSRARFHRARLHRRGRRVHGRGESCAPVRRQPAGDWRDEQRGGAGHRPDRSGGPGRFGIACALPRARFPRWCRNRCRNLGLRRPRQYRRAGADRGHRPPVQAAPPPVQPVWLHPVHALFDGTWAAGQCRVEGRRRCHRRACDGRSERPAGGRLHDIPLRRTHQDRGAGWWRHQELGVAAASAVRPFVCLWARIQARRSRYTAVSSRETPATKPGWSGGIGRRSSRSTCQSVP